MSKDLKILAEIAHSNLKSSEECLQYLADRKISAEAIEKYQLGYFPQNLEKLKKYVSESVLQDLLIMDYRGCSDFSRYFYLTFPLVSEYQEVVGISGRTLLTDVQRSLYGIPKYRNSRFDKSNFLYGLNFSRESIIQQGNVYICEGYFDLISLREYGIENSVAICGTAFSRGHFLKLARYTEMFTFLLDGDESGQIAMEKIYQKFSCRGIKLRFKKLPAQYKDVDEFFAAGKGVGDFAAETEDFVPGMEWKE